MGRKFWGNHRRLFAFVVALGLAGVLLGSSFRDMKKDIPSEDEITEPAPDPRVDELRRAFREVERSVKKAKKLHEEEVNQAEWDLPSIIDDFQELSDAYAHYEELILESRRIYDTRDDTELARQRLPMRQAHEDGEITDEEWQAYYDEYIAEFLFYKYAIEEMRQEMIAYWEEIRLLMSEGTTYIKTLDEMPQNEKRVRELLRAYRRIDDALITLEGAMRESYITLYGIGPEAG